MNTRFHVSIAGKNVLYPPLFQSRKRGGAMTNERFFDLGHMEDTFLLPEVRLFLLDAGRHYVGDIVLTNAGERMRNLILSHFTNLVPR